MPESIPLRTTQKHRAHANGSVADGDLSSAHFKDTADPDSDLDFDDWDEHDASMPAPGLERNALLGGHKKDEDEGIEDSVGSLRMRRRSTGERDPETQATFETRKKYTYAAITLALSLVSFTVQTETAVYIQHQLKWEKPYCMLYVFDPSSQTSLMRRDVEV
jgi:hypothetical protein